MNQRYPAPDTIRGITLISMFLYHAVWDLVYLFGFDWPWYSSVWARVWQQSICWTFLFLSGFCQPFGKRKLRRAAQVFGGGMIVTAVTVWFLPSDPVIFGVLTLLGSCMFLWIPLEKALRRIPKEMGLCASLLLFAMFYHVNDGFLGFGGGPGYPLPRRLYHGLWMTWIGFTDPGFYSVDYFSLLPWIFLFLAGYFCNETM